MGIPLKVLLVEDSASDAKLIVRHLELAGFTPYWERVDSEMAMKPWHCMPGIKAKSSAW